MSLMQKTAPLEGKKGLVVGIANSHSIATGCAKSFKQAGADLALTYINEKSKKFIEPVAQDLETDFLLPLDVMHDEEVEAVFKHIEERWGKLDFILHSIAFCPKEDLHGRVVDCSREGFNQAMDISVHSFMRLAKFAEPLMKEGGSLLTMSYYGAEKVVDHYNVMGPVKAALEAVTKSMAAELGPENISVNAISPGPLKTRAASGIDHFDELIERAKERAPERRLVTLEDIGALSAFLVSDAARSITGTITHVDAGYHIIG